MSWEYEFTPEAVRALKALGPEAAREIRHFLDGRIKGAKDPRAFGKPLRHSLKGLWRYRVRDWRILCRLQEGVCTVLVLHAGHRSRVHD